MAWTERQREAIETRGKNLLVSAAAGSGKTAVLVERVIRLILKEGVSLDSMLIVTFTNAAAAEMKERIYEALNRELAKEDLDRDARSRLRTQIGLVGRASISTFNKFALDVVHRYYHVLDLKPGMAVCDEARQSILQREALEELMEEKYAEADEGFLAFLDRYASSKGDSAVREMILRFHRFLQSLPYPWEWTDALLGDPGRYEAIYRDFVLEQAHRRASLARKYFLAAGEALADCPKLQAKNEGDIAFASGLCSVLAQGNLADALAAAEGHDYAHMSASKDEKDAWGECRDRVRHLRDKGKAHVKYAIEHFLNFTEESLRKEQEMMLPQLRTLISLTREFSSRYGAKKGLLGLLDFSDTEHFALEILKNEDVREELRSRFSCIFVDEYQDSNLVQETLIERVAGPDNVFRVGDVKQSIYKFRLAEPELFLDRCREYRSGDGSKGKVIDLNSNFRSKKEIIDLVNRVFSVLMTRDSAGMDYTEDEALVQGSSYRGPLAYPPVLSLINMSLAEGEEADPEIEDLKAAELEALNAVELIREYHGKMIRDDKKQCDRPLEFRDMAVLLRAVKGDGEVFYKILTDAGIPVFLERGEGYFDTVEIQVFLNLLRIIDNRSQDFPFLSVLRSPVFGFCAAELAQIRIWAKERGEARIPYNRAFALYREEGPEGPLREKCRSFTAKLDRWRMLSRHMPLGDFLWELLTDSGYASFAAAVPGGEQRLANLRALADKARQYEEESAGGLFGFIGYVDAVNSRGGKVDVGQVKILSENEDVVRLMTIHKSKGLEFPFVLLAGLGRQFRGPDPVKAEFHKHLGASLRLKDPASGLYCDPTSLDLIRRKKAAEERAENIRILYVAMTRPKDIILMSAAVKDADKLLENVSLVVGGDLESCRTYVSALLPVIPPENIKLIPMTALADRRETMRQQRQDLEEKLRTGFHVSGEDLPLTKEEIAARLAFSCTPGEGDSEKRKYSVSQIAAMEREKKQAPPRYLAPEEGAAEDFPDPPARETVPLFISGKKDMDAASRGTAYHKVMEHLPFTKEGKDPDSIRAFMEEMMARGLLTEAEFHGVDPRRIGAFFRSSTGRQALEAKELYRELPFTMRHWLQGREVLVQGTIDCCFLQEDGWVLADYKSNYINREHREEELARLRAEYLPQLALYREALEGITGKPVKKAVLYLFGIDEELIIDDES